MASSSNSEPTATYDVFLSFRGLDTRKKFTDHLYEALNREGFRTFRDKEEIPTGKFIKPQLRKAIMNSRMSVVVLSKNYANSKACLFELQLILRRRRTQDHLVLPVFYEVDPQEIKKQVEKLNFSENEVMEEQKKRWSQALKDVAKMKGMVWQNKCDGYETKFIEDIVGDVNKRLGKHRTFVDHQASTDGLCGTIVDHQGSNQISIPPTNERVPERLLNDKVSNIAGFGKRAMKQIHNRMNR